MKYTKSLKGLALTASMGLMSMMFLLPSGTAHAATVTKVQKPAAAAIQKPAFMIGSNTLEPPSWVAAHGLPPGTPCYGDQYWYDETVDAYEGVPNTTTKVVEEDTSAAGTTTDYWATCGGTDGWGFESNATGEWARPSGVGGLVDIVAYWTSLDSSVEFAASAGLSGEGYYLQSAQNGNRVVDIALGGGTYPTADAAIGETYCLASNAVWGNGCDG